MKLALMFLFFFSSLAISATNFGAFTDSNHLYVTILGDCNNASATLVVDSLCNKNRLTRNFAIECGVEMVVATSRMVCSDQKIIPKVFVFDLGSEPVAPEALEMDLKYQSQSVKMKINR